jgi:phosphogluconate dehydratase
MPLNKTLLKVTDRIIERSKDSREKYVDRMKSAVQRGPRRAHLSCGNQAHAYAAMGTDKEKLANKRVPNIGVVSAYNDMLSAHQPFHNFPDLIKREARNHGGTAQVAGGVPAMCDGITQGETGMELSLFSRDVIAMAAGIALSHNTFDTTIYLGVCDKIVPGLVIAAATFGFLPAIFLPAGPMTSGLPNNEKSLIRQKFATGEIDRAELMSAEMKSYHGPGTCTFYGTANSNQMLMEFMGLQLPGSSFVNPGTPLRDALTRYGTQRALDISSSSSEFCPAYEILNEKAFVNGIVGLMATGGSTNLVLHIPAMAKAAGINLAMEDFEDIAKLIPLMAKIYPNGLADVNHFHAAGGLSFMINELLNEGLLHDDVKNVNGHGMSQYRNEARLIDNEIRFPSGAVTSTNQKILRPLKNPFQITGGLKQVTGNLGSAITKVSAVEPDLRVIKAPVKVFQDQEAIKSAFKNNEFQEDTIFVVRFQGPRANGMPELHSLTPVLSTLQDRGLKVALVTDGRMSGASGKVPSAIHVTPEAASGGPISKLRDGDIVLLDADNGILEVQIEDLESRPSVSVDLSDNQYGLGRELFNIFRENVGPTSEGANSVL